MVHWNCSSALCFNNIKSLDKSGNPVKYYKLPKDKKLQREYMKFFKTSGMNWKSGYICSAHWSTGTRASPSNLPDIAVPVEQFELLKLKFERAKQALDKAKCPTVKQKLAHKKAKQKLLAARTIINKKTLKTAVRSSRRETSMKVPEKETSPAVKSDIEIAEDTISKLKAELREKEMKCLRLEGELDNLKANEFTYLNLLRKPRHFEYYCGLSIQQFDLIFKCLEPYLHLLPYPDNHVVSVKLFSVETQLLITITICRHALDLKFMAFFLNTSKTTVERIFNAFIIYTATVFNRIDLVPGHGFLLQKMPKIFVNTGHGLTDLIIDATEFKFECATNYDVNSLMFSNYKNTQTGKALVGIAPHGMGIVFSDIYPGSISDSNITEKTNILKYVEQGHELMTDRGFAVQDLCAIKGIFLNRPKQKEGSQFTGYDVHKNFDIAATRIHVERFIGRVRNWKILNNVWSLKQMDLLSSTWQMLCHIVNITMEPIGPKEENFKQTF